MLFRASILSSKCWLHTTSKHVFTTRHTLVPWTTRILRVSTSPWHGTPPPPTLTKGKEDQAPASAVLLDIIPENVIRPPRDPTTSDNTPHLVDIPDTCCHVQKVEPHNLLDIYKSLSKFKLTSLVVATTVTGYCMAPGAVDPSVLAWTILGTGLTSCSANSLNQFLEIPYDSQMARTKNRVLVRGLISPLHAVLFAGATGIAGVTTLALGTNGLTAALGLANLVLYAGVYTPLKRCSIVNTWVGAVVGAIPPIMGWAACTNSILDPGAFLLGAILYSWQFPHFNALSWNLRGDYSRAGYRMMAVTRPELCRRVAIRHTALLALVTAAAPFSGMVPWDFAILSMPFNFLFTSAAINFYDDPTSTTSRQLFRLSLLYLLGIVSLMVVCAKFPPFYRKARQYLHENPSNAVI